MIPGAIWWGDEVLFKLGKLLAGMTNDKIQAARIGGEEFAIILDSMTEQEVARCAQTILESVGTILINNQQPLSISIGVGFRLPDEAQDVFIRKVDEALYRAKNNGRGRIEWATEQTR